MYIWAGYAVLQAMTGDLHQCQSICVSMVVFADAHNFAAGAVTFCCMPGLATVAFSAPAVLIGHVGVV